EEELDPEIALGHRRIEPEEAAIAVALAEMEQHQDQRRKSARAGQGLDLGGFGAFHESLPRLFMSQSEIRCDRGAMADVLVVEKSARQRKIETVLLYLMPLGIGAACRFLVGPGLWQVPAILLYLVAQSLIGNAIALRIGGELVTPEERWRRAVLRMMESPLGAQVAWSFLFFLLLFSGLCLPMAEHFDRQAALLLAGLASGGAAVASLICLYYVRSMARQQAASEHKVVQEEPWAFIRASLKLRPVGLLLMVLGLGVVMRFGPITDVLILLAFYWAGAAAESVLRTRVSRGGPLLWPSLGFGAMLTYGALQPGLSFALFAGSIEYLSERVADWMTWLAALAGFVGGVLYVAVMWGLAKFNSVKRPAPS